MNTAEPIDPLERVTARGLEQRQAQELGRYTGFFVKALRDLPDELKPTVKLISSSTKSTLIRLEIARHPFDLETSFSASWEYNHHRLYHAGLPLVPAIENLEGYSRQRAAATQRSSAKELLWMSLGTLVLGELFIWGLGKLVASDEFLTAKGAEFTTGLATGLGALYALAILSRVISSHGRVLGGASRGTLKPVDTAMREGFERWMGSVGQHPPDKTEGKT